MTGEGRGGFKGRGAGSVAAIHCVVFLAWVLRRFWGLFRHLFGVPPVIFGVTRSRFGVSYGWASAAEIVVAFGAKSGPKYMPNGLSRPADLKEALVRRWLLPLLMALGVLFAPGIASAQIHPANSALVSDSPSLAPALPGAQQPETAPPLYGSPENEGATMFQGYFGYSWTQFQAFDQNLNGFQGSFTMFIHEIGLEGQYIGELGSRDGYKSRLTFAGGGVHVRFRTTSKTQPWVHVLVGEAHYSPQTAFGGRDSFAWEAGLGIDYAFSRWISVRAGGDAFGTQFFHDTQVNPIVHGGIVFNF